MKMTMILTPKAKAYLLNRDGFKDRTTYECMQDAARRFLLPFDDVSVAYVTDEGPRLATRGKIIRIDYEKQLAEVRPTARFEKFGFKTKWYDQPNILRFPTKDPGLCDELGLFLISLNEMAIRTQTLHIDGKRIN